MNYAELVVACRSITIEPTACETILGISAILFFIGFGFFVGWAVKGLRDGT